ncbi:outer membrane lipoprotein-sorting protein [Parasphingorhabdus cellanae]|uniref:Outer membrane lipoprotein-sorting protein n=1 Tax=Parasphingorhabdus cellanae TaxID=2806553 RepID=A0ABX7T6U8_9SPHN|nr:outer membrane lipoprotein-sorting protein [Parasphingorhabdus cellanae]QTD57323.1 outer membrane lipoprotein-sorting protein [Parasphingorhabdus cellanae]
MILRNAQGQQTKRTLQIRTLERVNGKVGDKSVLIMRTPADVKGTTFLSHAKLTKPDDQWIFLPALKRVKRIASVNKSGPFLGSEFAYEDFTSQEFGKFTYQFLRQEKCGSRICDVIERKPLYRHSGYSKQIAWIDQKDAQFRRIEFFNRAGSRVKTLKFSDYRKYSGRFWRAHRLEMTNHRNGKFTALVFGQFAFNRKLSSSDFVKGSLARLR